MSDSNDSDAVNVEDNEMIDLAPNVSSLPNCNSSNKMSDSSLNSDSSCSPPDFKYNRRRRRRHNRSHDSNSSTLNAILTQISSLNNYLNSASKPPQREVTQTVTSNQVLSSLPGIVQERNQQFVGAFETIDQEYNIINEPVAAQQAYGLGVETCPTGIQSSVPLYNLITVQAEQPVSHNISAQVEPVVEDKQTENVTLTEQAPNTQKIGFPKVLPTLNEKEPKIKPVVPAELEIISSLQKFGCHDWMNIPFFDTQKMHLFTPGFCALKTNHELKPVDNTARAQTEFEHTLSAITHAVIVQRTDLQQRLQALVDWAYLSNELTADAVTNKVKALFMEDTQFTKANDDILQIACGRRASIIQHRRNNILKQCSNSIVAEKLRDIPPSNLHLFENTQLERILVDNGGTSKNFHKPSKQSNYKEHDRYRSNNSKVNNHKSGNYKPHYANQQFFRNESYQRRKPDGPAGYSGSRKRKFDNTDQRSGQRSTYEPKQKRYK